MLARAKVLRILVISAIVLGPCLWQPLIPSGDLPSHLYNAWLAILIRQGHAPGLWIAHQWTNVGYEDVLSWLMGTFSPGTSELIAVCASVLVFFWGAFSFICAVCERRPWFVAPCVGILAYGWAFQMGFSGFYLSVGFSLFALAIVWRGTIRRRIWAIPLVVLAWLSHPLPVLWLAGVGVYAYIARGRTLKFQVGIFLFSLAAVVCARLFLTSHFRTDWSWSQLFLVTGVDQAWVFGREYALVAFLLLLLWGAVLLQQIRRDRRTLQAIPFQLFLLTAAAIFLLPGWIKVPMYNAAASLLAARASLFSGVLACSLLGMARPKNWHKAGLALTAALFFGFLYRDARAIGKVENKIQSLVASLPAGQRILVLPTLPKTHAKIAAEEKIVRLVSRTPLLWRILPWLPPSRIDLDHIADRICVGRCFSYGNYEASTGQFPVRADPGNAFVEWNPIDVRSSYHGTYIVRPGDLPLYQIFPCGPAPVDLCLRALKAGEKNGDFLTRATGSGLP